MTLLKFDVSEKSFFIYIQRLRCDMRNFFRRKALLSLSPLEGYNRWASSYGEESNPIRDLSDGLVKKFLPDLKNKAVLDAGCGTGKFCAYAETQQAAKIVGVDLSPAMIEEARRHCPQVEFRCGDLAAVSLETEGFDVIVCALVLGYVEQLEPSLRALLRALKKGGVILITDLHPFLTLLQAKRTFLDARTKKTYEIRHHLHLFQEYFQNFSKEQVIVESFEEPVFGGKPTVFGIVARKIG